MGGHRRVRSMKLFSKILKGFAYVWGTLVLLLILATTIVLWMNEGFGAVQDRFSPFNIWNALVTAIAISPAVGAHMWAKKLDERSRKPAGE